MSTPAAGHASGPPPDNCPYPRPFSERFADCATFQAQRFAAATTQEHPLGIHISCAHLRVGEHAHNRFYAQCALGTAADRRAWLLQVGQKRVAAIRRLGVEFARMYEGRSEPLLAAKAAAISRPDDPAAAEELDRRLSELSALMSDFMTKEAETLEAVGFPAATLQVLIDDVLDRWRASPRLAAPPIPDEQLQSFPPELRSFLGGSPREHQEATA